MPNTDTSAIRTSTRRIKTHIANKYLKLADRVDEKSLDDLSENERDIYWKLTYEFARNVVPRSQEITGEDGEAINVNVVKYADNPVAIPVSTESIPASDTPSV